MLILDYASKKVLREAVGQPLSYHETSIFGTEYADDGELVGCNRPHITGHKREFFAQVVMEGGRIKKVR